ncbi:hypothetical protein [Hydrogenoanaerobacterium sp.]|uniref:hypothetical protein n=1 Tax=Hydrogenoanaerobacterium sp. TaxID=2953763 RepID=UPI00289BA4AE|nr:hypothetical protein [Hydrogenoanaerobacterium sp.]
MNDIKHIMDLLGQKKELFTEYERITNDMLTCSVEELEAFMSRRGELIKEIDAVVRQITEVCEQDDTGLYGQAVKNKCSRSELPEYLVCIFDFAQTIFAVMNRVANIEPQIMERLLQCRDELEQKIKSTNNAPKIAKYLTTVDPTFEAGTFLNSKK